MTHLASGTSSHRIVSFLPCQAEGVVVKQPSGWRTGIALTTESTSIPLMETITPLNDKHTAFSYAQSLCSTGRWDQNRIDLVCKLIDGRMGEWDGTNENQHRLSLSNGDVLMCGTGPNMRQVLLDQYMRACGEAQGKIYLGMGQSDTLRRYGIVYASA